MTVAVTVVGRRGEERGRKGRCDRYLLAVRTGIVRTSLIEAQPFFDELIQENTVLTYRTVPYRRSRYFL